MQTRSSTLARRDVDHAPDPPARPALSPLEQLRAAASAHAARSDAPATNVIDSIVRSLLFERQSDRDGPTARIFLHADRVATRDAYPLLTVSRALSGAAQRALDRYVVHWTAEEFHAWRRRGETPGSQTFGRCKVLILPSLYDAATADTIFGDACRTLPSLTNLRAIDFERVPNGRWADVARAVGTLTELRAINIYSGQFDFGVGVVDGDEDRPFTWAASEVGLDDLARLVRGSADTLESLGLAFFRALAGWDPRCALPGLPALVALDVSAVRDAVVPLVLGIVARAPRLRSLTMASLLGFDGHMTPDGAAQIVQATAGLRSLHLGLQVDMEVVDPDDFDQRCRLADVIVKHAPKLEVLMLYGTDQLPFERLIGAPRLRMLVLDASVDELAIWSREVSDETAARVVADAPMSFYDLVDFLGSASAPREIGHVLDRRGTAGEAAATLYTRALQVCPISCAVMLIGTGVRTSL